MRVDGYFCSFAHTRRKLLRANSHCTPRRPARILLIYIFSLQQLKDFEIVSRHILSITPTTEEKNQPQQQQQPKFESLIPNANMLTRKHRIIKRRRSADRKIDCWKINEAHRRNAQYTTENTLMQLVKTTAKTSSPRNKTAILMLHVRLLLFEVHLYTQCANCKTNFVRALLVKRRHSRNKSNNNTCDFYISACSSISCVSLCLQCDIVIFY